MVSRWPPLWVVDERQDKGDLLVAELLVFGTGGSTLRRDPEAGVAGEPDRTPVFGADPVVQLRTAALNSLIGGRLDQARRHPGVARLWCDPEVADASRVRSFFIYFDGCNAQRRSITLGEQPIGPHHAVSPVLLGLHRLFGVGGKKSFGGLLQRRQTHVTVVLPALFFQHTYSYLAHAPCSHGPDGFPTTPTAQLVDGDQIPRLRQLRRRPGIENNAASVSCGIEPGNEPALADSVGHRSQHGEIHAANEFRVFARQLVEGAVAQHDRAAAAAWLVPVVGQGFADGSEQPFTARMRAGRCPGLVPDSVDPNRRQPHTRLR